MNKLLKFKSSHPVFSVFQGEVAKYCVSFAKWLNTACEEDKKLNNAISLLSFVE